VKELTQWWSEAEHAGQSWLILGKGPSLDRRDEFDLGDYRTIALNHAVLCMPVDAANIIDLSVVQDCGEILEQNAGVLLMPRYPHVDFKPSPRPLESHVAEINVLKRLSEQNRLIWYNFTTGQPVAGSPRIEGQFFSAEVTVNLLAVLGIRSIRTLGVDGGNRYATGFDDKDRLANRHSSFDLQWAGITKTVRRYGIDYAPLTTETPIRVFIGTDESQRLGARVLEFSIRQHTPVPVVCDTMDNVAVPLPKSPENQPRTEFSFHRFAIPALAGFQGRAVYLDADMLVFRNFLELWDIPFEGASVLYAPSSSPTRPSQFSVLLLNCAKLKWDLNEIVAGLDRTEYDYDGLMKTLCIEPAERIQDRIPADWNSLEEYHAGRTGLLHYTDMPTQPWVSTQNPHGDLWVECLKDAIKAGFIDPDEVRAGVERGFVRPSLLWQLKLSKRRWPFFTDHVAPILDRKFRPHKKLTRRLKRVS